MIDADKLKAKVRAQEWKRDPTIMLALNWIYMLIDNAPTIGAVPVVRCGECKYAVRKEDKIVYCRAWGDKTDCAWDIDLNEADYCSYGEKMEDKPCG